MTVRNRRTKRDAKIKQYLLGGYTLASIAKFTKISPTRVGQIRNLLLESGELVEIPHTNPRVYADPHAHALGSELLENDGGVEMNGLTRDGSQVRDVSHIRDSLPPNGRLPMGMVNAHISGRISMTVRKKGDFKDIQGTNGLYMGYWETESSGGRGKIHRRGHLRLFRQDLTVNFYESTKGTMEFYVNPGRVYYYPSKVKRQQVIDYIIERCLYMASTLRANGWQLTDPQLPAKYQLHRGKENDPLATLIPPRYHDEGQLITSDTSPDYLETEIENADDERLIEIYADSPKAIRDLEGVASACSSDIERMKAEILGLKDIIQLQGESITSLTGNVSMLVKAMTEMTTLQISFANRRYSEFTGEGYQ